MNSTVIFVEPLLFPGAGVTCRAGGRIGGLVLLVPEAQQIEGRADL